MLSFCQVLQITSFFVPPAGRWEFWRQGSEERVHQESLRNSHVPGIKTQTLICATNCWEQWKMSQFHKTLLSSPWSYLSQFWSYLSQFWSYLSHIWWNNFSSPWPEWSLPASCSSETALARWANLIIRGADNILQHTCSCPVSQSWPYPREYVMMGPGPRKYADSYELAENRMINNNNKW